MTFLLKNVRTGKEKSFTSQKILECLVDKINDRVTIDGEDYYLSSFAETTGEGVDFTPFVQRIQALEAKEQQTNERIASVETGDFLKPVSEQLLSIAQQQAAVASDLQKMRDTELPAAQDKIGSIETATASLQQSVNTTQQAMNGRVTKLEDTAVSLIQGMQEVKATSETLSRSVSNLATVSQATQQPTQTKG